MLYPIIYNNNYGGITYGSTSDYMSSNIKVVIDSWATDKFDNNELKLINGYKARLITKDELVIDLGCIYNDCSNSSYNWLYGDNYWWYFTMTPYNSSMVYRVIPNGSISLLSSYYSESVIRPVINVYKSAIDTNNE